ncbi:TetR family transcriptional regulator C-terminal domain-containing protein [Lysobacter antibioticus]|uniref:TetR family transcriptional regulator C-terminal domain-containing protein n=1 Tax=Lysobacter antibioticus TaxID=84531 RepID=UPI003CE5AD87
MRILIRVFWAAFISTYTRRGRPSGCLVVSAAASAAPERIAVQDWLAQHRLQRTQSSAERIRLASDRGELLERIDVQALGDFYATVLHGVSVRARDGVGRALLLEAVSVAVAELPLQAKRRGNESD